MEFERTEKMMAIQYDGNNLEEINKELTSFAKRMGQEFNGYRKVGYYTNKLYLHPFENVWLDTECWLGITEKGEPVVYSLHELEQMGWSQTENTQCTLCKKTIKFTDAPYYDEHTVLCKECIQEIASKS